MLKRKLESTVTSTASCDDDKSETPKSELYRENNHIYFYDEINRITISQLNGYIRDAEEYSLITSHKLRIDPLPIYLHIYSNGGYIHSAFAAIDAITSCKAPVYSVIEGATASAGTLLSVVCTKRYIRPNAYMLIHQLSSSCWGKMAEITDEYQNLTEMMKRITTIYAEHSTLGSNKLKKLLQHDLWLDSTKAMEYGLVDEIYT